MVSPAVSALVNALRQTEKYGTPLANSLRILSQEFRLTRAGSVPGLYYSCVGQGDYLACRRLDGAVRAWRIAGT